MGFLDNISNKVQEEGQQHGISGDTINHGIDQLKSGASNLPQNAAGGLGHGVSNACLLT